MQDEMGDLVKRADLHRIGKNEYGQSDSQQKNDYADDRRAGLSAAA
jgi:hypothetical protein